MRGDLDFADVTLVCEDKTQIEAHKIIISASSPFFKDVLYYSYIPILWNTKSKYCDNTK